MFQRLLIFAFLTIWSGASAQEVGIRVGTISGNAGFAVDGIFHTEDYRMHVDFGVYQDGAAIEVLWDLVYAPIFIDQLYGYIGFGTGAFFRSPALVGTMGEFGIEYQLTEYPIKIGLDWRPTFWIISETGFNGASFGLNVRWCFTP